MQKLFSLFTLLLLPFVVLAQQDSVAIHFQVLDDRTGEPIPFVAVRLFQYDQQLRYYSTDLDGGVTIDQLGLSRYDLKLSLNGYQPLDTTIYTTELQRNFTVYLLPADKSFEPVIIIGYQVPLLALSGPPMSYNYALTSAPVFLPATSAPIMSSAVGFDPYYCIDHNKGHWHFLDSLEHPKQTLEVFELEGKKGVSAADGHIIIEPFYKDIRLVRGIEVYRFLVQKDQQFGLMNEKGEWVIPCEYDQIFSMSMQMSCIHKRHLLVVIKDGKYGLITTNGDVICPAVYEYMEIPASTYICPAQSNLMRVKQNGKYGCVDETGQLVIEMEYDSIGPFVSSSYAFTRQDGKYGIIQKDGNILLEPHYDSCVIEPYADLILASENKKWGALNDLGEVVVPFAYDEIKVDYLLDRLFFVRTGSQWGLLNSAGTELLHPQFDELGLILPYGQLIQFRKGSRYGILSESGAIIQEAQFQELRGYSGTLIYRNGSKWGFLADGGTKLGPALYDEIQESEYSYYTVRLGNLFGVADNTGRTILKPVFEEPADLYTLEYYGVYSFQKEGKFGLVDTSGTVIIKPLYDEIFYPEDYSYTELSYLPNRRNGKPVLVNSKGVEVIGPYYDDFYIDLDLEDYFVVIKGEYYGLISHEGKKIFDPVYTAIVDVVHLKQQPDLPAFIVSNTAGTGVINSTGKTMIPFVYDKIWINSDSTFGVTRNDSSAVIDHTGKVVVNFSPYTFRQTSGNVIIVYSKSGYGLLDMNNNLLCEAIYSRIEVIIPGKIFKIYHDGGEGILNANGEVIIPPVYENVKCYLPDLYAIKKSGSYGFMDSTGTITVPHRYEKVKEVSGNRVVVRINNKFGIVDLNGNELLPVIYDDEISLEQLERNGLMTLRSYGKFGLIRSDLTVILAPVYSQPVFKIRGDSYQVVSRNGFYGVLDSSYAEAVPCIYPSLADYLSNGTFVISLDLKEGLIDQKNNTILPCEFEMIRPFRFRSGNELQKGYIVQEGLHMAVYDQWGKPLTEFTYDMWKEYWDPVFNRYIDIISKKGKWYTITASGEVMEI